MHFRIGSVDPHNRARPHVYYDAGGERPATETEVAMHAHIGELKAAIERYIAAVDREIIPEGDTEVGATFFALRTIVDMSK